MTTSTTPDRFTDAPPDKAAETPTPAMSSLLVAVTATPWAVSVLAEMVRGPAWLPSPVGACPSATMLCERPAFTPGSVMEIADPPLLAASCSEVGLPATTFSA